MVPSNRDYNKAPRLSSRTHGHKSISEETTNSHRAYLVPCSLTSVALTVREIRCRHSPVFNLKWKQLLCCLLFAAQNVEQWNSKDHKDTYYSSGENEELQEESLASLKTLKSNFKLYKMHLTAQTSDAEGNRDVLHGPRCAHGGITLLTSEVA